MPIANITAAKIFPPKPNKKRFTIVGADEVLWGAMGPVANQMTIGGSYEVIYKIDHFNGIDYKVIEEVKALGGAPTPAAYQPTARPTTIQPPAAPVAHTPPAARYGATDMVTAERIFVCGAINAILSNPNVKLLDINSSQIIAIINTFRNSWDATFGGNPDMGSERIPY